MGFLPEITNSVEGTAKNFADPGGFLFGNNKGVPSQETAELDPSTRAAISRNQELNNIGDMDREGAYRQLQANTGLDVSNKGAGYGDMKDRFMRESGLGGEAMGGALQSRMDKKYDLARNQQQRNLYASVPAAQMQALQAQAGMASMNNAIQARQNMAQYQNDINQEAARNQVVNNIGSMAGQVVGMIFGGGMGKGAAAAGGGNQGSGAGQMQTSQAGGNAGANAGSYTGTGYQGRGRYS